MTNQLLSMLKKIFIVTVLFIYCCSLAFSQSRKELIKYADAAFESGNYSSAVYFYSKIIGSFAGDEKDLVYPYQLIPCNRPPKQEQTDSAGSIDTTVTLFIEDVTEYVQPFDTIVSLSDTVPEADTTTSKNTIYRHSLSRLPESSRLSYDYENAEIFYARCFEDGITEYPLLLYWYADGL